MNFLTRIKDGGDSSSRRSTLDQAVDPENQYRAENGHDEASRLPLPIPADHLFQEGRADCMGIRPRSQSSAAGMVNITRARNALDFAPRRVLDSMRFLGTYCGLRQLRNPPCAVTCWKAVRGVTMQSRAEQQIGSGVVRTWLRPSTELQHAFSRLVWAAQTKFSPPCSMTSR
jgi:hypothetical protein